MRGGSELRSYEDLMNVWRILALEAQIVEFYTGLLLMGGSVSNGLNVAGAPV